MVQSGFMCPECRGFSGHAKNCGTKGCRLEGKPLVPGYKCGFCGKSYAKTEKHGHDGQL